MPSQIIEPHIFDSLDWLRCGMTAREAVEPGQDRLALAARLADLLSENDGAVSQRAPVVVGEQVHGDEIAVVGGEESDMGLLEPGEIVELPGVDALIGDQPGLFVGVFTADCVPIVFADPERRTVAVAHAGREGTRLGIARKVLDRLQALGSKPTDLLVWVGPSISVEHYEVSVEIAGDFRDHFGHYPGAVQGPDLRNLALGSINWCELISAGIPIERIELDARCTFESVDLFHSYRRDGADAGRMLTFAGVVA
jgi:purine-nucleoside/S-methyl-5'-thioadenosine phosphorylase / adenosine deaminase